MIRNTRGILALKQWRKQVDNKMGKARNVYKSWSRNLQVIWKTMMIQNNTKMYVRETCEDVRTVLFLAVIL